MTSKALKSQRPSMTLDVVYFKGPLEYLRAFLIFSHEDEQLGLVVMYYAYVLNYIYYMVTFKLYLMYDK